jgi:general secretion pathway protein K
VAAAVALATAQAHAIRRTANLLETDRAWALVGGIELAAEAAIRRWREKGLAGDTTRPVELAGLGAEARSVRAEVSDLQARFNLNNLLGEDGINERELARFEQLLDQLDLEDALAATVADWLDADSVPRAEGAEDDYYSRLPSPYRAANGPLSRPSELLLVRGITPEVLERLLPYVTALPGRQPINVNTAPEALLLALHPDTSHIDVLSVIDARRERPFEELKDFLAVGGLGKLGIPRDGLGTRSRFFELASDVTVDRVRLRVRSLLEFPQDGRASTLRRVTEVD